jgi:hypothetical protein
MLYLQTFSQIRHENNNCVPCLKQLYILIGDGSYWGVTSVIIVLIELFDNFRWSELMNVMSIASTLWFLEAYVACVTPNWQTFIWFQFYLSWFV